MQKCAVGEWIRRRGALVALTTTTIIITGCGGGGGGAGAAAQSGHGPVETSPAPAPGSGSDDPSNQAPTINGSPITEVSAGAAYKLSLIADDADGDTLAFSIENRPAWASFNTATGELTGTPAEAGTYANIAISVSDGKASASLPNFSIVVVAGGTAVPGTGTGNAVALSWDVPTQTETGESLSDLKGYRIHYGSGANALSNAIEVQGAGSNTYTVQDLPAGTYYFAVRAITEKGEQSRLSNVVSRVVG